MKNRMMTTFDGQNTSTTTRFAAELNQEHTTPASSSVGRILAIDLGHRSSVSCLYTPGPESTAKPRYRKVPTTPEAMHDVLVDLEPDRLVIEIGPSAGWVHDLACALDIEVEVANTNHEAWRWQHVKRKTDRRDALKLAELSSMNQLPTVHMPSAAVRAWRSVIAYRQTLVKRRTQMKNSIRSILSREGLKMPAGKSGWTKRTLAWLEAQSTNQDGALWRTMLAEELQQLHGVEASIKRVEKELNAIAARDDRVALLRTIPGVGARLAETVVAVIDDPHRFRNARQVGNYGGLTPRIFQSGTMNRQGRISGEGNALLRSLLVEVSWLGLRCNAWMREVYERVRRGSDSRKKIAIVAVARRLLVRCWAMLRDHSRWRLPNKAKPLRLAA